MQAWGNLVGVRPVKLVHYYKEKYSDKAIKEILIKKHRLNEEKADLIINVANIENAVTNELIKSSNNVALYINIPFCPSRCTYCSFITIDNSRTSGLQEEYLQCLLLELKHVLDHLSQANKRIKLIYIGGGTPTVYSSGQLKSILALLNSYDLSGVVEFTVEAGRADTVTDDKFMMFKQYGVTRVSINPQSMNLATLTRVNRVHSIEQVYSAVSLAKKYGFTLNMDMILGLPAENKSDVLHTITKIKQFEPENITIHNLALKRASYMNVDNNFLKVNDELITEMNRVTKDELQNDYYPYYLYRQKNTVGGHANIGYCKSGHECLYNIAMISELCSIYACGAGSVTKILDNSKKFERLSTPKDAVTYIKNINAIIDKKIRWFENEECK